MKELRSEIYKTIFETWRYEVDSYWQRNNYFAAFETVALAGGWYVVEHKYLYSGLFFASLGVASTLIWFVSSIAVHKYIAYWWQCIKDMEAVLSLQDDNLSFATRHPGSGLHPSRLVHVVPVLFMIAWFVVAGLAVYFLFTCRC
jgi:hypothetical protein